MQLRCTMNRQILRVTSMPILVDALLKTLWVNLIPQSKRDVQICTHDDLNNINIIANLKFQFPWAKGNRRLDLAVDCLHQLTNGVHLLPVGLAIWQLAKMHVQKVEQKVRESVTWSHFQLTCHPSCLVDIHTHSSLYWCIIPWQPVAYRLLRRLLLNACCCDAGVHADVHLYHANAKLACCSGYHQAVALWWIINELKLLQLWSHNFYSHHWPIQPSDQCAGGGWCGYSLIWHYLFTSWSVFYYRAYFDASKHTPHRNLIRVFEVALSTFCVFTHQCDD